jgi:maleate isomerase
MPTDDERKKPLEKNTETTRRIGLILPADNVIMEPELYALGIERVVFNAIRLMSTDHDAMRQQAQECGAVVNELGLDAVVYACAETSFNAGAATRQSMSDQIASETGLPVVTATDALNAALRDLAATKISLLTPYTSRSGAELEATLADAGVEVVSSRHHDFRPESGESREWYLTNRVSPERIAHMAEELDTAGAQALVIASTNLASLRAIPILEKLKGIPVLTTNQAIISWCAKELGFRMPTTLGHLSELVNEHALVRVSEQ